MNSFYSREELASLGLDTYGQNVLISRKTSIYGAEKIVIGNNVRIDDFCILSGKMTIGNYIHIGAYSGFFAGCTGITIGDFSTISSKVSLYALSDDYSGESMTSPMIPDKFRNVTEKEIIIGRQVIIGTGTSILPGVEIAEGCSIGAMSLVNKSTEPWGIYVGIPAKWKKSRSKNILELEKDYLEELRQNHEVVIRGIS